MPRKEPSNASGGPWPPEDNKALVVESLVIGAGKYRHEIKARAQWLAQERRFYFIDSAAAFDGKVRKSKRDTPGQNHRQGSIRSEDRPDEVTMTALYPLFMSFRPVDSVFRSFDINEFSPTGAAPVVGANACVELTKRKDSQQFVMSVCLDPAREYVMTRMRTYTKNVMTSHVEITYKRDPEYGWVPDAWQFDSYEGSGRLFRSQSERVTRYDFNADIDESTFDLDFEPRTIIRDAARNEFFIVREDGSRRRVAMEEVTKPFEELMTPEPKSANRPLIRTSVVVLAAVALALATALIAYRWRRRTRATSA